MNVCYVEEIFDVDVEFFCGIVFENFWFFLWVNKKFFLEIDGMVFGDGLLYEIYYNEGCGLDM